MPIKVDESGNIIITGSNSINFARLVTMRSGLELEIKSGIKLSRHYTTSNVVREAIGSTTKNKKKLLAELIAYISHHYPTPESAQ